MGTNTHQSATVRQPSTAGAPALEVCGLSKTFGANLALQDFDLEISPGEIHVLLGQNGSGKSTLIKILSGFHSPDPGGTVRIGGEPLSFGSAEGSYRRGCRFVHQDLGLIPSMSILDNLCFGVGYPTRAGSIRRRAAMTEARATLERVGITVDPGRPVSALGAAEQTELAVARALRGDDVHPARLIVLDEPTATLPVNEVEQLLATVRAAAARGVGILYVTHHLDEVFQLAHRITVLRDGRRISTAAVTEVTRAAVVDQLVGGEIEQVRHEATARPEGGPSALSVDGLSAGPLRSVSFSLKPKEVLGFAGLTGSGRETILGSIFGAVPRAAGSIAVAGREVASRPHSAIAAGLGFMPGDRKVHGGIMAMSAQENLTISRLKPFWSHLRLNGSRERQECQEWFERLDVRPDNGVQLPLASFSGGNQQKILFGKWLRLRPAVFLLDEPTQGVDIGAKAVLHKQLLAAAEAGAAVAFTSSDVDELVTLCDRVLVIRHGRIRAELTGDQLNHREVTHAILSDENE